MDSRDCTITIRSDMSTVNDMTTNTLFTNTKTFTSTATFTSPDVDWSTIIRQSLMENSPECAKYGVTPPEWMKHEFRLILRAIPDATVDIPAIRSIDVYNDKVVKVTFVDDTFTKCVCDDDEFNEYTGIAFCLFKRLLGKDGHKKFNRLMHYAMKRDEECRTASEVKARAEKDAKEKRRKAELKRAAKAAKARQEKIDIQSAAVLAALHKYRAENGEDM